jgi:DNA-binding response OmpR family regulator
VWHVVIAAPHCRDAEQLRQRLSRAGFHAYVVREQEADAGPALSIDHAARAVRRGGSSIPLRPKEYALLCALWARRGHVVRREELLRDVWQYAAGSTTRTVDSHVFALRRKIEPAPAEPRFLLTVNCAGYRLVV